VHVVLFPYLFLFKLEKFLLMLRSLKRGLVVDADHPQMHENIVDFVLAGMCTCYIVSCVCHNCVVCLCNSLFCVKYKIFQIHNTVQDATDEQLCGPVKLVVDESLPKLLGSQSSLDNFNRDYLTRHKDSINHLLTGQHMVNVIEQA